MNHRLVRRALLLVSALALSLAVNAAADDAEDDPARQAFKQGAALVEQAEWSNALAAFERSRGLREHALTIYNIAVCQRFLGRYTLARETFHAALARAQGNDEMPQMFVEQATAYVREIEQKLGRVTVHVTPKQAEVAVEGRPLTPEKDRPGTFVAGLAAPGEGKSVAAEKFDVLVDPGTVVFTFSLGGYDTIELRRDVKPGSTTDLPVSMAEQPASVHVAADRPRALVRVDAVDVGLTPVELSRPPGTYQLAVSKEGFETYEAKLALRPGQSLRLDATLLEKKVPVTKRWWFWSLALAVAGGIGVTTYFVVRPAPTRPDVQRGGLNWAAEVQ